MCCNDISSYIILEITINTQSITLVLSTLSVNENGDHQSLLIVMVFIAWWMKTLELYTSQWSYNVEHHRELLQHKYPISHIEAETIWLTFSRQHFQMDLFNENVLVQIMAWHRPGDKPLSEPMMVCLLIHLCVIRPHWHESAVFHKQITMDYFSVSQ